MFNREMKRRQKNWAAVLQDGHQYDYLREEVKLEFGSVRDSGSDDGVQSGLF